MLVHPGGFDALQTSHRWVCGVPHHFFRCQCCVVSHLPHKLAPSSTRATVSVVVRVQLFFSRCCCCCCCSFVAWCHHCLCLAHARRVQSKENVTLVQLSMPVQIDYSNCSREQVSLSFHSRPTMKYHADFSNHQKIITMFLTYQIPARVSVYTRTRI